MCLVVRERNGSYRWDGWSWTTRLETGSLMDINDHLYGSLKSNGVFNSGYFNYLPVSYASVPGVYKLSFPYG